MQNTFATANPVKLALPTPGGCTSGMRARRHVYTSADRHPHTQRRRRAMRAEREGRTAATIVQKRILRVVSGARRGPVVLCEAASSG
eukprot:1925432-Prymnesium_polylepis.1